MVMGCRFLGRGILGSGVWVRRFRSGARPGPSAPRFKRASLMTSLASMIHAKGSRAVSSSPSRLMATSSSSTPASSPLKRLRPSASRSISSLAWKPSKAAKSSSRGQRPVEPGLETSSMIVAADRIGGVQHFRDGPREAGAVVHRHRPVGPLGHDLQAPARGRRPSGAGARSDSRRPRRRGRRAPEAFDPRRSCRASLTSLRLERGRARKKRLAFLRAAARKRHPALRTM